MALTERGMGGVAGRGGGGGGAGMCSSARVFSGYYVFPLSFADKRLLFVNKLIPADASSPS